MLRLALLLLLAAPVAAQPAPESGQPRPVPRADAPFLTPLQTPVEGEDPAATPLSRDSVGALEVSLLTMMPGQEVYSLFGHSALRVRVRATGEDRVYNYGTFDFNQPGFLLRFVRGQLDYRLEVTPYEAVEAGYRALGRPIIEQHLDLAPAEAQRLFRALETNYLPENRTYRYSFFFDNCSTRLLDQVEAATNADLVGTGSAPRRSFRDLIRPYIWGRPLLKLGITLGLGQPTDRVASRREEAFLPLELLGVFDDATLRGRPLVAATDTVFWVEGAGLPDRAFDWTALVAWLVLALAVYVTLQERRRPLKAGRALDAALLLVAGLVGLVLAPLWLATEHGVTGPNLNLLWAWPTHLVAAGFVARGTLKRGWGVYLGAAALAAALVALVSGLGLVAGFVPLQLLPAAVPPLALALALRLGFSAYRLLSPTPAERPLAPGP